MGDSILARLSSVPTLGRAAHKAKLLARRMFLWPLHALRKSRLRKFGLARRSALSIAELRLVPDCPCPHGAHFVPLSWGAVKAFARAGKPTARALTPTAMTIDLEQFPDFASWRKRVSTLTQGKYHRSANKARRLGYTSRFVGTHSYERSLYELTGSKSRRSKGVLVWAAIAGPRSDLVDSKAPAPWPECPRHWRLNWGAFQADGSDERLAAFAMLVRAGDLVWVQSFIGHGAALTDGVTKMLMFDVMEWLLARRDPCAQGVRCLVHGSLEEGAVGLFDWKRYLAFKPTILKVVDHPQNARS
ncbi:MAG: hypothetical protein ABSC22_00050 [Roseiarcus sp.]